MTGRRHPSDPDIFFAARKVLDARPSIPQDVRVHVYQSTVTVTGIVRWPHEKSDAEAIVRHIEGVRETVNKITVAHAVDPNILEAPESR